MRYAGNKTRNARLLALLPLPGRAQVLAEVLKLVEVQLVNADGVVQTPVAAPRRLEVVGVALEHPAPGVSNNKIVTFTFT
jgi:hypothetical protein